MTMLIARDASGRVVSVGETGDSAQITVMGSGFLLIEDGKAVDAYDSLVRAVDDMRLRNSLRAEGRG